MDRAIEELDLSVRAYNVLKRAGINFESEIKKLTYIEVFKLGNMRRGIIAELEEVLNIEFKKSSSQRL